MEDALRNYEALARRQLNGAAFEVDQQRSFNNVEELIVVIMLVPLVFAFDHSEADYGIVYLTECLVVPRWRSCVGEGLLVDQFEMGAEYVEACVVCVLLRRVHFLLRKFLSVANVKTESQSHLTWNRGQVVEPPAILRRFVGQFSRLVSHVLPCALDKTAVVDQRFEDSYTKEIGDVPVG